MPINTYSARPCPGDPTGRGRRAWFSGALFSTVFCLLFLFSALLAAPASRANGAALEAGREMFEERRRQVARQMEEGTLWVLAIDNKGGNLAVGSSFVVAEGRALTNAHVTNGTDELWVGNARLPLTPAKLLASDYDKSTQSGNDFALISFAVPKNVKLPVMTFSLDIARTDRVSAWGFPLMVTQFDASMRKLLSGGDRRNLSAPPVVYTEGTVSTIVRQKHACIIHTASIAGGNSGGPLVNRRGQVVGINTWGYHSDDEGAFLNASLTSANMLAFLTAHGVRPQVAQPDWEAAASREDSFLALIGGGASPGQTPARSSNQPEQGFLAAIAAAANSGQAGQAGVDSDWSLINFLPSQEEEVEDFDLDPRLQGRQARDLLEQAAEGEPEAMTQVGAFYLEGANGFPEDLQRAWHWLEAAADEEQAAAQGLLGMLYLLGDDEDRDPELALEYLVAAAEAEEPDPEVQGFLAYTLYGCEALGIRSDLPESFKWAQISAQGGSSTGQALLGRHYFEGLVVERNPELALQLARQSVQQDDSTGKALLALIYFSQAKDQAELDEVIRLCHEAAEYGESLAQGLLASIYAFNDQNRDLVAAERWGRLAADQASPLGQYVLGSLYLNGWVVEQNYPMAWAYLEFSSRRLNDLGLDESGTLLEKVEGLMTARDRKKGREIQAAWLEAWELDEF